LPIQQAILLRGIAPEALRGASGKKQAYVHGLIITEIYHLYKQAQPKNAYCAR
jgi:hypothetical protein